MAKKRCSIEKKNKTSNNVECTHKVHCRYSCVTISIGRPHYKSDDAKYWISLYYTHIHTHILPMYQRDILYT